MKQEDIGKLQNVGYNLQGIPLIADTLGDFIDGRGFRSMSSFLSCPAAKTQPYGDILEVSFQESDIPQVDGTASNIYDGTDDGSVELVAGGGGTILAIPFTPTVDGAAIYRASLMLSRTGVFPGGTSPAGEFETDLIAFIVNNDGAGKPDITAPLSLSTSVPANSIQKRPLPGHKVEPKPAIFTFKACNRLYSALPGGETYWFILIAPQMSLAGAQSIHAHYDTHAGSAVLSPVWPIVWAPIVGKNPWIKFEYLSFGYTALPPITHSKLYSGGAAIKAGDSNLINADISQRMPFFRPVYKVVTAASIFVEHMIQLLNPIHKPVGD
jgi:hypothetical protein